MVLLALAMATSGVEFDALLFTSSSDCDFENSYGNSSAAAGDWWADNLTANFTELCSGMIDTNSTDPIYSFPRNSSDGNYSYCKIRIL